MDGDTDEYVDVWWMADRGVDGGGVNGCMDRGMDGETDE